MKKFVSIKQRIQAAVDWDPVTIEDQKTMWNKWGIKNKPRPGSPDHEFYQHRPDRKKIKVDRSKL